MDVFINRKRLRLKPQQAIGKGGEADVFTIGNGQVLKLFKPPSHPDYAGQPHEQQQAEARVAEHQAKLPAFPGHVPGRVVRPEALVNREVVRPNWEAQRLDRQGGLLPDDTTLIVLRRRPVPREEASGGRLYQP